MATLTFVIGLATATPCINHTVLVEGHRVKVSAVDLGDFRAHICQSLHQARLILGRAFRAVLLPRLLVQGATPGKHASILRQGHRMVVTASHCFGADRQRDLREFGQVDDPIGGYSQLAVQVGPTDEHFATLTDDCCMVAARADAAR